MFLVKVEFLQILPFVLCNATRLRRKEKGFFALVEVLLISLLSVHASFILKLKDADRTLTLLSSLFFENQRFSKNKEESIKNDLIIPSNVRPR